MTPTTYDDAINDIFSGCRLVTFNQFKDRMRRKGYRNNSEQWFSWVFNNALECGAIKRIASTDKNRKVSYCASDCKLA